MKKRPKKGITDIDKINTASEFEKKINTLIIKKICKNKKVRLPSLSSESREMQ